MVNCLFLHCFNLRGVISTVKRFLFVNKFTKHIIHSHCTSAIQPNSSVSYCSHCQFVCCIILYFLVFILFF
ncbi:hypothetical protein FKM82_008340 [Ascaphus truei]